MHNVKWYKQGSTADASGSRAKEYYCYGIKSNLQSGTPLNLKTFQIPSVSSYFMYVVMLNFYFAVYCKP